MKIVDGKGKVLGKLCTRLAKELLGGETVHLVNAEQIVVTGNRKDILEKFRIRYNLTAKANPLKGPKFSRMPDRIVRRSVKGMLPSGSSRGREALKKLHVHISTPQELAGKERTELKVPAPRAGGKYMQISEVSRLLGARW